MNRFNKILYICICLSLLLGVSLRTAPPSQTTAPDAQIASVAKDPSLTSFLTTSPSPLNSAYVRDIDLGNGQRAALVSALPLNYLAEDGSWRPIDARFQSSPDGFTNTTNPLKIAVSERTGALGLENAGQKIAWIPQAVVWLGPNGQEISLAHPLDPAQAARATLIEGGTALRYDASWSLPGLSEVIATGPGSVEESLILAARPTLPGASTHPGEEAILAFRATLHLPQGATLFANRAPQPTAFSTAGEVEVRDAVGQSLLTLTAPFAFEQATPTTRVAATYHLTPLEGEAWQVEIRTPWHWWQAVERQYPAVLDPYMTVYQATLAASTYSEAGGCSYSEVNEFHPGDLYRGSAVAIGRNPQCAGVFRALVRFDTETFPTLPVGATIQNLELFAAAAGGYFRTFSAPGYTPVRSSAAATVEVRQVMDDWGWTSYGGVQWGSYQTSGALGTSESFLVLPPENGSGRGFPVHFSLPSSVYNAWVNGQNFGLELRLDDETWYCADCGNFVEIPDPPNWTGEDTDTNPTNLYPDGGGFMLVINYQTPELQEGITYGYDPDYPLPTDRAGTAFTDHQYGLPDISTSWSAVAVKGIWPLGFIKAAGHPRLRVDNYLTPATSSASNYMMMRGNPGNEVVEIPAFQPTNGDELAPTEYIMEVRAAEPLNNGNPIQPGQTVNYSFEMSSREILRVFELNLVEGSNVRVQVQGLGMLKSRLFPPAEAFHVFGKGYLDAVTTAKPLMPVESGGLWGLVVEFPGNPSESETGAIYTISVNLQITACNAGVEITDQGCWQDPVPTAAMFCAPVGPYWIRSEEAFLQDPDTLEYYNTSLGVTLGWGTCSSAIGTRWMLVTNEIRFKNQAPYSLNWDDGNNVSLVYKPGSGSKEKQWFWYGGTEGNPNPSDANYGYLLPEGYLPREYQALPLDETDAAQATLKINVQLQQAEGQADIIRQVETRPESLPGVLETFTFSLEWTLQADVALTAAYSHPVDWVNGPNFAEIGAMELHPENNQWEMDFHPGLGTGVFGLLRTQARIAHTAQMGGAWKPVQAVILPFGEALPGEGTGGNTRTCPINCLDIRHPTIDTYTSAHRNWELPDIEITGEANMMAFSKPGSLDIFSTDQPNDLNDMTVPFSFKTVGGYVTSYRGVCPGDTSNQLVQIIQGSTQMSLPGIGDDTSAGIAADFTLCQNSLHDVFLSYSGLPLPVGTTGLFINRVGGRITLTPENTQVEIDVDYRSASGGDLTKGKAKVTINTAGLFSAQILDGTLVGIMNYDGYANVTWNPMSFSTGLHGWMDVWILHNEVNVEASVWQGQGWQHQYWWLPDDGASHFAGSFSTRLSIPEGAILSDPWFPDIPWDDWDLFTIHLMIGEFHCGDCSGGYEYGIQGAFSHAVYTLGYDVGLYVGFESGIDVILGGGQHMLVNQYPGLNPTTLGPEGARVESLLIGGKSVLFPVTFAPDPTAVSATFPLTVTGQTSSMLVGLGWENLASHPRLTLIRPDAVEITPENAASYGIHFSTTPYGIFYGIEAPLQDTWTAKISNATEDDFWHLIYFANNQVPDFTLLTPDVAGISWNPNWDGEYTIEWDVPAIYENDEYLEVSLFYTKTVSGVITPTTGVIVDKTAFYRGYYNWDLSFQGVGTYQVWGALRNGGSGDYFTPPSELDEHQWLGMTRATAPGTIELVDEEPPTIPTGLHLIPLDEAFLACWNPSPSADLAGYLLTYLWDDVNNATYVRYLRVPASVPYSDAPGALEQCARIGNLNAGKGTAVMVAGYDSSNNLSANSNYVAGLVEHAPDGGPNVSGLAAVDHTDHSITVTWTHDTAASYRLYYAVDTLAGPQQPFTGADEGASPLLLGAVGTVTLHGLPVGHRIHFAIQAFDSAGRPGAVSDDVAVWLSSGIDADDDGLPDDWENAFNLGTMGDDPDHDCLVNLKRSPLGLMIGGEYWEGTNPLLPDTDGDGYMDGQEVSAGSDPLDPASQPEDLIPAARLALSTHALMFRAGTLGSASPPQYVQVLNTGAETLTPVVSVDAAWLLVQWVGDQLQVSVNQAGLAHGEYLGTITIGGAEGVCTVNAPQTITVSLGVFDGLLFDFMNFLPIITRE